MTSVFSLEIVSQQQRINHMDTFKVALVQYDNSTPDTAENTERAIRLIQEAKRRGADFVLFPEAFLSSYAGPKVCEELRPWCEVEKDEEFQRWYNNALTEESPELTAIRSAAKEEGIGVCITGFSKGKKSPGNTAWIIDRNGDILLKYNKVHTCDWGWEGYLESGEDFPVCDFDGIKMGVMICYDREYPESARELMLNGAEFIMHPNSCGSMFPRLRELSVRAMENMVSIAMANPPGKNMGNSCAYTPIVWAEEKGVDNTLFVAPEKEEGLFLVEFDIKEIREYRDREDLGKYRKPKAYRNR